MRIIAHLDMDAFFAAIEERDRPRLKGKPIVVGSDPRGGKGRGIIATANYKAREYGIHSAMPISTAWQLSERAKKSGKPAVNFISGDHRKYGNVSAEIMKIIESRFPSFEPVSIDEAFFDISSCGSYEKARIECEKLKKKIKSLLRLTATVGIAPNKLVAKIASDLKKPDGLTVVLPDEVQAVLDPLPV